MNFKESSDARTYLRAGIATVLGFLGALATALTDNSITYGEWIAVFIATLTVLGAYLGIGAGTISEPFYGKKMEVAVPIPPATDEPNQ